MLQIDNQKAEFRKRRIALILSLLFFIIAWKLSSQNTVYRASDKTMCFAKGTMKFNLGANDTTIVSAIADSGACYVVRVFVKYPESRKCQDYTLAIGFEDGCIEYYKPYFVSKNYNYVEYLVPDYNKMKEQKFDYIAFVRKGKEEACIKIRTKDFFMNFIADLK